MTDRRPVPQQSVYGSHHQDCKSDACGVEKNIVGRYEGQRNDDRRDRGHGTCAESRGDVSVERIRHRIMSFVQPRQRVRAPVPPISHTGNHEYGSPSPCKSSRNLEDRHVSPAAQTQINVPASTPCPALRRCSFRFRSRPRRSRSRNRCRPGSAWGRLWSRRCGPCRG